MTLPTPDPISYKEAKPFPHAVFDGVFHAPWLKMMADGFPKTHERLMEQGDQLLKGSTWSNDRLPIVVKPFIRMMNEPDFLTCLSELTGIPGLIPDPFLLGGGLHETFPGGHLKIHTDYTNHEVTGLERVVNVLIYLNEDWKDEWNGHLELWDAEPKLSKTKPVKIAPIFNRMVVFNTTENSFHGHPEPLKCPKDRSRKSIALYYFRNGRNLNKITTFVDRREDRKFLKGFIPPHAMTIWNKLKTL